MRRVPILGSILLLLSASPCLAARADAPADPPKDPLPKETLAKPEQVRAKLRDGSRVRAKVTAFDSEGFDGEGTVEPEKKSDAKPAPFTRAKWLDVAPAELEALLGKILDEKQADDLVLKGELLLAIGESAPAEKAWTRAARLDPAMKPRIAKARTDAAARAAEAEAAERAGKHKAMCDGIPNHGARPWPLLDAKAQDEALAEMKRRAEQICRDANMRPAVVETRYFVLYGAVNEASMRECARSLDAMYEAVLELFGIPAGLNLFWGKAVVLLTPTEETFRLVEAAGFKTMTPKGVVGLCHQVGPAVFVNMFWSNDQDRFDSTLIHETVHGIVHRYYSDVRLPDWANEGLSEYIAMVSFKTSPVKKDRMPQALSYIRSGRSVADVMRLNYRDGSWPGPDAIGYAVGYAVVKLMIRQQPEAFGRWIRAVKGGKPWEDALREDFGHPVEAFAPTVEQWYRTNG